MLDHHFDQNFCPRLNHKPFTAGRAEKTDCRRKSDICLKRSTLSFWPQSQWRIFGKQARIHGNRQRAEKNHKLLSSFKSSFQARIYFSSKNMSNVVLRINCRYTMVYKVHRSYTIDEHDMEVSRHGTYPNSWMVCNQIPENKIAKLGVHPQFMATSIFMHNSSCRPCKCAVARACVWYMKPPPTLADTVWRNVMVWWLVFGPSKHPRNSQNDVLPHNPNTSKYYHFVLG